MEPVWSLYGALMEPLWSPYGALVEPLWSPYGALVSLASLAFPELSRSRVFHQLVFKQFQKSLIEAALAVQLGS